MSNPPRRPIDPLLQQRLEQLSPRKTGQPLPPPKPETIRAAAPVTRQQPATKAAVNARQAKGATPRPATPRPTTTVTTTATPDDRAAALAARVAALNARKNPSTSSKAGAARSGTKPGGKPGAAPSGRRNKPAKASKMAALGISIVTTAGLAAMFAQQDHTTDLVTLTGGTTLGTTATTVAPAAGTPTTAATATTAKAAVSGTAVKDGTYTGSASQNRWGTVQVAVVYSGGKISDVQILQYPDSEQRSVYINQQALPMLIQETVQAQTAKVDTIGGATYTSHSYKASLQSAIDAAKKASGITG